jgi:SAM-dependent methyltransferase
MGGTLSRGFFEDLYVKSPDPFDFETSGYEAAKYQHTVAILPRERYHQGAEIGCSIGVLTSRLSEKCENLLGIDISEGALQRARQRCAPLPGVKCVRMTVPDDFPDQIFDLMVVSEVAYYWSTEDLAQAKDLIAAHQTTGGHLLLVRPPAARSLASDRGLPRPDRRRRTRGLAEGSQMATRPRRSARAVPD